MRYLRSLMALLFVASCQASTNGFSARMVHHQYSVLVQELVPGGLTEPVHRTVRIRVRSHDGAVLVEVWTSPDGVAQLSFDAPEGAPEQIEAAVPRFANDPHGPFNGAIVGVGRDRRYCIILPPGCLL
jgi:hypothetical protein